MSLKTKTDGLAACLRFGNPLQLALARLFFRKTRFVPHRLGGAQFVADQSGGDECGLRPCLVEGMYDPFLAAAGISSAGAPLDIADLGANAGGFSLIFAARRLAVRKILAVEMNPLTHSRLRLNLLTNFGPAAVPLNAAVGGRDGAVQVPFTFGGTGDSVSSAETTAGSSFEVPMLTLDSLLGAEFPGRSIDLLKMDIEGAEWDVLGSGQCRFLANCKNLIVEIHPRGGRALESFADAVRGFGLLLDPVRNPAAADVFLFRKETPAGANP